MKNLSGSSVPASKPQACLHMPNRMQCSGRMRTLPRPWHLFARQYLSFTCSSYSSRKYLMVESTGLGALFPRPQSEPDTTILPIFSSLSMSPFSPLPEVIFSINPYICQGPIRQGGHLPQDSLLVKDRKYFATSTMQSSSSSTTMPPEPMIDPTLASVSKSAGMSRNWAGMQPPEGPPVWTALNFLSGFSMPPPMSKIISRSVIPMGTSMSPVFLILPVRAKTFVPFDFSVPMDV